MIDLATALDGDWDERDVHDLVDEYLEHVHVFENRHPPRYVNPGLPLDHDSINYFPHWHYQDNLKTLVESKNEYTVEEVFDYKIFGQYGIDLL